MERSNVDGLFTEIDKDNFDDEDDKFRIITKVSRATGVRVSHKMLNEINTISQLKSHVNAILTEKKITPGNPLEELFDMKKPPSNLRIVQFRRKIFGGPLVLIE